MGTGLRTPKVDCCIDRTCTLVGLPTGAVVGMQIMQSGFAISDGGSHCMADTLLQAEFGKDTATVSWVGGVGHETVELCRPPLSGVECEEGERGAR